MENKKHYETYPYPPRDAKELHQTFTDTLEMINFNCFDGKETFNNFRILVPGCGTGDGVVWLALQLKDKNCKIVALDISQPSLDICKSRVEYQELDNVEFINHDILKIDELQLDKFDYISCSGCLHHLIDPVQGLINLKNLLKPSGAIAIMVYAKYGRTGVYQIQNMMRIINGKEKNMQLKVDRTKEVISKLGPNSWYNHQKNWFTDTTLFGDNGIYDIFLHGQDRCYDVEELYNFIECGGMRMITFSSRKYMYNPENYGLSKEIVDQINSLDAKKRYHIGEILSGHIITHEFYIRHKEDDTQKMANIKDLENIPYYLNTLPDQYIENIIEIAEYNKKEEVTIIINKNEVTFKYNKYLKRIFNLIDGNRTLFEIFDIIIKELNGITHNILVDAFTEAFTKLSEFSILYLRHASVPKFRHTKKKEIEKRLLDSQQTRLSTKSIEPPKPPSDIEYQTMEKLKKSKEFKKLLKLVNKYDKNKKDILN